MKADAMVIYENTVSAAFVRRLNRFTAEVLIRPDDAEYPENGGTAAGSAVAGSNADGGTIVTVHVRNTGRLGELLLPGARVTLQKAGAGRAAGTQPRKTAYDLISVYKPGLEWVNIDSLVPNQLMKQYLFSRDYDLVRPEFTHGDSRFDFYMERGGEKYLTEVKGCTLAADLDRGIGLFPDAPTVRGVKHLNELAAAAGQGWHCAVAFVIQMNGIHTVLPNDATQPAFGQALARAREAGVEVQYFGCRVEADRIMMEAGSAGSCAASAVEYAGKNAGERRRRITMI